MDRRVKRTKSAVFNAVMDLMLEKDVSKITVLELCKRADINKSTFYLHYKSIDDCLKSCFDAIMNGVVEIAKNINYYQIEKNPDIAVNMMLNEIEKNIDYLCKFKSSNICAAAVRMLKHNLVKAICQHNGFDITENYHEIMTVTFVLGGCVDVLMEPLPVFNKQLLANVITEKIKSSTACEA